MVGWRHWLTSIWPAIPTYVRFFGNFLFNVQTNVTKHMHDSGVQMHQYIYQYTMSIPSIPRTWNLLLFVFLKDSMMQRPTMTATTTCVYIINVKLISTHVLIIACHMHADHYACAYTFLCFYI